jgi:hypothetical protein
MVLCIPEKVYWGWKSEMKSIPALRGMGRISPPLFKRFREGMENKLYLF